MNISKLVGLAVGVRRILFLESDGTWNPGKEVGSDELGELISLVGELELLPLDGDDPRYLLTPVECIKSGMHRITENNNGRCIICGALWSCVLRNGKLFDSTRFEYIE